MKNYKTKFKVMSAACGGALALFLPFLVSAETVVRTGHSVSIGSSQTVENDFYAAGSSVTHSGQVKEDLYAVAGSVTVNGPVGNDLTVVAGTVQVHAPVGDDVRVVGGDVVIASEVGGDVFVIGGMLRVLSSASIGGNVYFYGGEADIEGVVKGVLMGSAESFEVNGEVGGIDASALRFSLGEQAVVKGDVRYAGVSDIDRAPGAVIEGQVSRAADSAENGRRGSSAGLVFALAWVFTSLCFFLLLRQPIEALILDIRRDPLRIGLLGVAVALAAPILSFVLLATVLGAWIGVVLLLLSILLFVLCLIIMPIVLGGYLIGLAFKGRRLDVFSIAAGVVALMVFSLVPVIGKLLYAASFLMTLGAVAYAFYRKARNIV